MATKTNTTRKAKRKLTDITFEHDGAHVALVAGSQGGPANLQDYALVMKANNFSKEAIEKMQQVRVTMELPDFLEKFFGLWGDDKKVLAYMMGYVEPAETADMQQQEADMEYQDWIKSKMEAFEIIKSLSNKDSYLEVLSSLDEDEYLSLLKDQEMLEKAFNKESIQAAKAEEDETSIASEVIKKEVSASVVKQKKKEPSMTKEVDEVVSVDAAKEMVEKSALVAVEKALEEQKQALEKALQTIQQFEAEKKEAIVKAKTAKLQEVIQAEKQEILLKAGLALESDQDFDAFVECLKGMKEQVEKSVLFQEVGATADEQEPVVQESRVASIIKQKLQKQEKSK